MTGVLLLPKIAGSEGKELGLDASTDPIELGADPSVDPTGTWKVLGPFNGSTLCGLILLDRGGMSG